MLKSIAPIWSRLRHLRRPQMFLEHTHTPANADHTSAGQRLAERVAAFVGSWWFLGGQAFFLFLWLIYNTLQFTRHFDPPPYILLNLLLSFQAAFTGPVLLIAANVGALRDHQQSDRIESLGRQNEQLTEQNAQLAERLLSMEQMLDEHIAQSLKAHTEEIHSLGTLIRQVHAVVCTPPLSDSSTTTATIPIQRPSLPDLSAAPTSGEATNPRTANPPTTRRPRTRTQGQSPAGE